MQRSIPRIVIAGTHSGSGKTTVTCAILQALMNRGVKPASFKCGPDYIDPMFHKKVIGARSGNLDLYFFGENTARALLAEQGSSCDLCVIEGVMGFYDGIGLTGYSGSTFDVAEKTQSPVILVIDAKGMSMSTVATLNGFVSMVPESQICAVILNNCPQMLYAALAEEIRRRFDGKIVPLGYMPTMRECALESRHLGLITADEVKDLRSKLKLLAEQAEKSIDLDKLVSIARMSQAISYDEMHFPRIEETVRIAVARDEAFCFYYEDSLDVLRRMGAELVSFSPIHDAALPVDIHGLYLGGGYPELYAKKLSENKQLRNVIRERIENGLPCIAECGGYMYLTEMIDTYPMAGVLPGRCTDTGRLVRFGYARLKAERDCMLCSAGEEIAAHEFHHWDSDHTEDGFTATKNSGKTWPCAYASQTLYAGFPHIHFLANPKFAENFYRACLKEKQMHD